MKSLKLAILAAAVMALGLASAAHAGDTTPNQLSTQQEGLYLLPDGTWVHKSLKVDTAGVIGDGTDATGVTQPTGGTGIRGWLSGIYQAITGTLKVQGVSGGQPLPMAGKTANTVMSSGNPLAVTTYDSNGGQVNFLSTIGVQAANQYPVGAVAVTNSATGTTAATAATLPAASGKTTYICGFSIRANATAATTGNATVAGLISGTINFTQWTAPLASGIGDVPSNFSGMCIPASTTNTAIVVTSAAPGSGGTVSVSAWGYQL